VGTIPDSPLGRATRYPDAYDPGLLYAVERAPQRDALGLAGALPFRGADHWTAWEVGWLDPERCPRAGIARFAVPCASPRIVESKSVKLWLASVNHAVFATADELRHALERDLAAAIGVPIDVAVDLPPTWARHARGELAGASIDEVAPASRPAAPDASLLRAGTQTADETLVTHGFRSVCPVTGQPDYASIAIACRGPRLDRAALAAYLFGYRLHPGFHEHCVERIFIDIARACGPEALRVEARFTRRGGVDINPVRATPGMPLAPSTPTLRQ
jgi:7-cyano-7-deazaguanine reductase